MVVDDGFHQRQAKAVASSGGGMLDAVEAVEDLVLHLHGLNALSEVVFHPFLLAGICLDDIPFSLARHDDTLTQKCAEKPRKKKINQAEVQ